MPPKPPAKPHAGPRLHVHVGQDGADTLTFDRPFTIGRTKDSDVCIPSEFVSRAHAEVTLESERWWVRDLNSSNGLFVEDDRVTVAPIDTTLTIRLGVRGPSVTLVCETASSTPFAPKPLSDKSLDRYFGKLLEGEAVGEHTIMVRRAFQDIQKKQRWRYGWIVAILSVVIVASSAYFLYLRRQLNNNRALAQEVFYSMKALDLNIANVEEHLQASGGSRSTVDQLQRSRRDTEQNYDRFLTTLKVYDAKMTKQQRLILRVARIFGECELAMPPEFATEVENYIKKWQSSGRLARAVALANQKGYTAFISREFLEQDLPPQFFYLALQESDFNPYNVGPPTRMGFAKGMWQFIPQTAVKYGLKLGPLADFPRPDTNDERHHYDLATKAAAHYIKDLYRTDAQASGFLVMACYNWGESHILPLIQKMPANPRQRNFWQLLEKHRESIPAETYDYVFYIAAAAAIGEDPRLFGFNFDNPLLSVTPR